MNKVFLNFCLIILTLVLINSAFADINTDYSKEDLKKVFGDEEVQYRDDLREEELILDPDYFIKGDNSAQLDELYTSYIDSKKLFDIKKDFETKENKTTITTKLTPKFNLKNITIYEYIPKDIVISADDIEFKGNPTIIKDDPLVMWHYKETNEDIVITYESDVVVNPELLNDTITIVLVGDYEKKKELIDTIIVPLFAIPIAVIVIIWILNRKNKPKIKRVI